MRPSRPGPGGRLAPLYLVSFAFSLLALTVPAGELLAEEGEEYLEVERATVDEPAAYLPREVGYARVPSLMPVYDTLEDVRQGRVSEHHGTQGVWVAALESAEVGGETFYQVQWNWERIAWISGDGLQFHATLSSLAGVELRERQGRRLAIVHVDSLNVRSEPGVITERTQVGRLPRYALLEVEETRDVNGTDWYRIGEERWIHSSFARRLVPGSRPDSVGSDEKWIEVDVARQIVVAHEGDTPVFATLTSTGRPGRETVLGLYRLYVKFTYAPMAVPGADPGYDLADVPYVMYFHGGYGLHGGYWHDDYGNVRSNGCVNLSPHDAQWIFKWAEPEVGEGDRAARAREETPGTWVYVHE